MGKGGSFERECAKVLSFWWTNGETDDMIWRSDSSGARATQRRKSGKDTRFQFGDLTFTDTDAKPLFERLSIECKTGYGTKTKSGISRWDILDIIDSKQKEPVFVKMWNQAVRDAEMSKREPVLIFRRNGKAPCIAFTNKLAGELIDYCGFIQHLFTMLGHNIYIMNLSDFLKWTENLPNVWRTKGADR